MKHIILVSGHLQNGKNQFCDYFRELISNQNKTITTESFAKNLKEYCKEDFKNVSIYLDGFVKSIKSMVNVLFDVERVPTNQPIIDAIENKLKDLIINDDNWYENKTELTRILIQTVGTNIVRNRVDVNFWVNDLIKRLTTIDKDIILISDVRFESEMEAVYNFQFSKPDEYKVITVRVDRDIDKNGLINIHESEKNLDNYECWDYIVYNTGTLEDLKDATKNIIDDIFIPFKEVGESTLKLENHLKGF